MPGSLTDKKEDTFFVADTDVAFAIAVEVGGGEMGADSRIAIQQVWNEGCPAFVTNEFIPVEHGLSLGIGISTVVRPVAFAGGEVGQAIAIEVA